MTVSGASSTSYSVTVFAENKNDDPNITAYNNLSNTWNTYSSNEYLSSDFKEEMKEKLDDLKKKLDELENLTDTSEQEKKNEEIAKLINSLTAIINGSNSMISLDDRVKCLEVLEAYKIDLSGAVHDTIYAILNNTDTTYKNDTDMTYADAIVNTKTFYKNFYSGILDNYSNRVDQDAQNKIQNSINNGNYESLDTFYKDLFTKILEVQSGNLKTDNYEKLLFNIKKNNINEESCCYSSCSVFLNALFNGLVAYSVCQAEQDNISSTSRANLSNQTISMKVMQESNAYKLLEIDNLVNEALNKRAEMDPAMKRLRDGNYWGDNKEVKPQESIKPEDELWTEKQE